MAKSILIGALVCAMALAPAATASAQPTVGFYLANDLPGMILDYQGATVTPDTTTFGGPSYNPVASEQLPLVYFDIDDGDPDQPRTVVANYNLLLSESSVQNGTMEVRMSVDVLGHPDASCTFRDSARNVITSRYCFTEPNTNPLKIHAAINLP